MSTDPYQAYPSFPTGAPLQMIGEPAVQLIAAGPAKQRRLTVAFRAILAIPHFFALFFLALAAFFVAFVGWWGALFTGRLPGFAVTFLSGFFRWSTRVSGYMFLLTDAYPPFTLDDEPGYPVVIAIPEPGRLNRVAVFFRFILGIWGGIVVQVLFYGAMTIVLLIAWLITLITGQLPTSLHQAYTAVLRYQTRYSCYYYMLTSTYPSNLFGDEWASSAPAPTAAAPAAPAASGETSWDTPADRAPADADTETTEGYGAQPGYGAVPAYGSAPSYGSAPGYGTQDPYGAPAGYGAQPGAPVSWPLVLSQSAKNLMVVFIVLGVIGYVGSGVLRAVIQSNATNSANSQASAVSQWNTADTKLNSQMSAWTTSENNCGQDLTCVTKGDSQAAAYMSAFAGSVNAISMPSGASADQSKLVSDATKSAADFTTLSKTTSVAQYQSAVSSTGLEKDVNAVQTDITHVATAFNNS